MEEIKGLVSIIVPNYNHAPYLRQRLDSIFSQTYTNFEVIILDDCSTDHSREIISSYTKHPKISRIVFNEENTGSPFKQWRKGIELARGEFVWIAESDDWCEPTLLATLLTEMLNKEEIAISYCQSYCVLQNEIRWHSSHPQLIEVVDSFLFIKQYLTPNPAIFNASMAIWRKKNFEKVSLDFLEFRFSGDWLFWIELAKTGKVCISGKLLNYFRKHGNDVSTGSYQTGLNFVEGLTILKRSADQGLISREEYRIAIKKNVKEYWPIKSGFKKNRQLEIENMFQIPPSSKTFYVKCIAASIWKSMKSK